MKILAIETCTEACSVALCELSEGDASTLRRGHGAKDALVRHSEPGRGHGDRVLGDIDALLSEANWKLRDLDLVACGIGPGSFTGVRIGVSAAKAIAFGSDLPVLGISTLRIMAQRADADRVVVALDARMGEVYLGVFERDDAGVMQSAVEDSVIDPALIELDLAQGDWAGVGHGFATYRDTLLSRLPVSDAAVEPELLPHAQALIEIAAMSAADSVDPVVLVPSYVRDNVAKVKGEQ